MHLFTYENVNITIKKKYILSYQLWVQILIVHQIFYCMSIALLDALQTLCFQNNYVLVNLENWDLLMDSLKILEL